MDQTITHVKDVTYYAPLMGLDPKHAPTSCFGRPVLGFYISYFDSEIESMASHWQFGLVHEIARNKRGHRGFWIEVHSQSELTRLTQMAVALGLPAVEQEDYV